MSAVWRSLLVEHEEAAASTAAKKAKACKKMICIDPVLSCPELGARLDTSVSQTDRRGGGRLTGSRYEGQFSSPKWLKRC